MADKKTGSARRPSRDEDEAPKKKQSGTQKSLKKSTSARKAPADDDDDDAPPAKPTKKGSARQGQKGDSARQGGGAPPKSGPDAGRIFLYFVPGMILLLLGAGVYVMNLPDAPKKQDTQISFDGKVAEAKKKYLAAKAAFDEGNKQEGERGVPKLSEAYRLLCEGHNIIQGVRDELKKLEESKDPNVKIKEGSKTGDEKKASATGYQFDDDDKEINSFKVMVRKALAERPGGMESIKQYVEADQKAAAAQGDDPDGLLK